MFMIVVCLIHILQIQNILISFRDTSDIVNLAICKRELDRIHLPRLLQIYLKHVPLKSVEAIVDTFYTFTKSQLELSR